MSEWEEDAKEFAVRMVEEELGSKIKQGRERVTNFTGAATMEQDNYIGSNGLAAEPMPSLADVAQAEGGAWPKGWYSAEVIPGYQGGSYTFETADTASKAGDSRNLRLCLKLTSATLGERNTFFSTNYRITDLTAANVARIKEGNADTRLKIALGKLGQIEKAFGFSFTKHPAGHLITTPFVGQRTDVYLGVDKETGYNEVNSFAKFGTRAK